MGSCGERADLRHSALGADRHHRGDARAADQGRDALRAPAGVTRAAAHLREGGHEPGIRPRQATAGRGVDREPARGGSGVAGEPRRRVPAGRPQARGLAPARVRRLPVGERGAQRVPADVHGARTLRVGRRGRHAAAQPVVRAGELGADLGDAGRRRRRAPECPLGGAEEESRPVLPDGPQLRAETPAAPRTGRGDRGEDERERGERHGEGGDGPTAHRQSGLCTSVAVSRKNAAHWSSSRASSGTRARRSRWR